MVRNKEKTVNKECLLQELLADDTKLCGVEKQIRNLTTKCGVMFAIFKIIKYPIIFDRKQWRIVIYKNIKGKDVRIYDGEDMELSVAIKASVKFMDDYIDKHKEYDIGRGGSEFV